MIEHIKVLESCCVPDHAIGPDKQPPLMLSTEQTKALVFSAMAIVRLVETCERVAAYAESMNWESVARSLREALAGVKGGVE